MRIINGCAVCGNIYLEDLLNSEAGNPIPCPKSGCSGFVHTYDETLFPTFVVLAQRGYCVIETDIRTPNETSPRIEIVFKDFYHFSPLPDGFEIESEYTHRTAPINSPTKIVRYFDTDLSMQKLNEEWAHSLVDFMRWALSMPLPVFKPRGNNDEAKEETEDDNEKTEL